MNSKRRLRIYRPQHFANSFEVTYAPPRQILNVPFHRVEWGHHLVRNILEVLDAFTIDTLELLGEISNLSLQVFGLWR